MDPTELKLAWKRKKETNMGLHYLTCTYQQSVRFKHNNSFSFALENDQSKQLTTLLPLALLIRNSNSLCETKLKT